MIGLEEYLVVFLEQDRCQTTTFCRKEESSQRLGRDVTKRAIIDVNPIVSGWNCDVFVPIIAQMLTSWPFPDLYREDDPWILFYRLLSTNTCCSEDSLDLWSLTLLAVENQKAHVVRPILRTANKWSPNNWLGLHSTSIIMTLRWFRRRMH